MAHEECRQHVVVVDEDATDPRQVIEADLIDDDALRRELEHARDRALETDRDVAEADRAMAVVEQRARDDADRVREVDDPRVGGRALANALGDLEHDGHRSQRLGEASGAGRLLADAAAGEGYRLVGEPRRLAPDPNLDEHEVRPVERGSRSLVTSSLPTKPCFSSIRAAISPTTSRRSGSMSWRTSSVTSIRSRSRESPETSSGVYVEPPPTTAIFIPSPPSG